MPTCSKKAPVAKTMVDQMVEAMVDQMVVAMVDQMAVVILPDQDMDPELEEVDNKMALGTVDQVVTEVKVMPMMMVEIMEVKVLEVKVLAVDRKEEDDLQARVHLDPVTILTKGLEAMMDR